MNILECPTGKIKLFFKKKKTFEISKRLINLHISINLHFDMTWWIWYRNISMQVFGLHNAQWGNVNDEKMS